MFWENYALQLVREDLEEQVHSSADADQHPIVTDDAVLDLVHSSSNNREFCERVRSVYRNNPAMQLATIKKWQEIKLRLNINTFRDAKKIAANPTVLEQKMGTHNSTELVAMRRMIEAAGGLTANSPPDVKQAKLTGALRDPALRYAVHLYSQSRDVDHYQQQCYLNLNQFREFLPVDLRSTISNRALFAMTQKMAAELSLTCKCSRLGEFARLIQQLPPASHQPPPGQAVIHTRQMTDEQYQALGDMQVAFREENAMFQQTLAVTGLAVNHNRQQDHKEQTQRVYQSAPKDPGGVEMRLGSLVGINMNADWHCIILDAFRSGLINQSEIEQILRELTIGIYMFNEAPWLSIEPNHFGTETPELHVAYKNTLVGNTITNLDNAMKGIVSGGHFPNQDLYARWIKEALQKPTYTKSELKEVYGFVPFKQSRVEKRLELERGHTIIESRMRLKGFEAARIIGEISKVKHYLSDKGTLLIEGITGFSVHSEVNLGQEFIDHLQREAQHSGIPEHLGQYLYAADDLRSGQIRKSLLELMPKEMVWLGIITFFTQYLYSLKQSGRFPELNWEVHPRITPMPVRIPHYPVPVPGHKGKYQPYILAGGLGLIPNQTVSKPSRRRLRALSNANQGVSGRWGIHRLRTGVLKANKAAFSIRTRPRRSEDLTLMRGYMERRQQIEQLNWNPIHIASAKGDLVVVCHALDSGRFSVHDITQEGITPLYLAAKNGHVAVVKELLNRGAFKNAALVNGDTPLLAATRNGHLDVIRLLDESFGELPPPLNQLMTDIDAISKQIDELCCRLQTRADLMDSFETIINVYQMLLAIYTKFEAFETALTASASAEDSKPVYLGFLKDLLNVTRNTFINIGFDTEHMEKSKADWEQQLLIWQVILQNILFEPKELTEFTDQAGNDVLDDTEWRIKDSTLGFIIGSIRASRAERKAAISFYSQKGCVDPKFVAKYERKISKLTSKYLKGKPHPELLMETAKMVIALMVVGPFALPWTFLVGGKKIRNLAYHAYAKHKNPGDHPVNVKEMKQLVADIENMVRHFFPPHLMAEYETALKNSIEALVSRPLQSVKTSLKKIQSYLSPVVDYSVRLRNESTILYEACCGGHAAVLEYFFRNPRVDQDMAKQTYFVNGAQHSLIELAVLSNQPQVIQILWQWGPPLSKREQSLLIRSAISNGQLEVLKTLVGLGLCKDEQYPLELAQIAFFSGHQDIVDFLFMQGIDIDSYIELTQFDNYLWLDDVENLEKELTDPVKKKRFLSFRAQILHLGIIYYVKQGRDTENATEEDLFLAYTHGSTEFQQMLAAKELPPITKTSASLQDAIRAGDIHKVGVMLSEIYGPDLFPPERFFPLPEHPEMEAMIYHWLRHASSSGITPYPVRLDLLEYQLNHNLPIIDIHQPAPNGWHLLHFAVFEGRETLVRFLINSGANVNTLIPGNTSALHLAFQHPSIIRLLLEIGSLHANLRDIKGMTPFHVAVRYGRWDTAEILFHQTTDFESKDETGKTVFHYLHTCPHPEWGRHISSQVSEEFLATINPPSSDAPMDLLKELLHRAKPNMLQQVDSLLQQHGHAVVNHPEYQRMLCQLVTQFSANPTADSPIRRVANLLYEEWLIRNNYLQLNRRERQTRRGFLSMISGGSQAIKAHFKSVEHTHVKRIKALQKLGESGVSGYTYVNLRNNGAHMLFSASRTAKRPDYDPYNIFYLYGKTDLDRNIVDLDGNTPFHYSVKWNVFDIAQWKALRKKGYLVTIQNKEGKTPLHIALEQPTIHADTVSGLIAAGAKLNVKDHNGRTPMQIIEERNLNALYLRGKMYR